MQRRGDSWTGGHFFTLAQFCLLFPVVEAILGLFRGLFPRRLFLTSRPSKQLQTLRLLALCTYAEKHTLQLHKYTRIQAVAHRFFFPAFLCFLSQLTRTQEPGFYNTYFIPRATQRKRDRRRCCCSQRRSEHGLCPLT